MRQLRTIWVDATLWGLVAAMFALGALVWPLAPDSIPVHWNLAGRPDRYAGKLEGLFLFPAIALIVLLGLSLLPRVDPNRARYAEFRGAYAVIRLAITGVLAISYAAAVLVMLGVELNIGLLLGSLGGLLLIVFGAVMDRLRPNWFVGIRTPWTLSNEESWRATHRAGKWVCIGLGVAFVLAGVLQAAWAVTAAVVLALVGVLGLVVYSYLVWRRTTRTLD